jgi:enoyl-CoA hydratase/carnithine racemase
LPSEPAAADQLLYEVSGGAAWIAWDRPDALNALSPELLAQFRTALAAAARDDEVRVVVLKGNGACFSAGADLDEGLRRVLPAGVPEGKDVGEYLLHNRAVMLEMYGDYLALGELAKPTIAQVHGWCLGAGLLLALAADLTIASDDAVMGTPEVRQGMPVSPMIALVAGWKAAMRYGLTGDHLDAPEALRLGLVNEVVPRAELDDRVAELVRRIALVPPEAATMTKQVVRRTMDLMGFRSAVLMAAELEATLISAWRAEPHGRLDRLAAEQGVGAAARERDLPFRPEPFGPRSRPRDGRSEDGDQS